ncbi:MAG TPA: hypothetical protein DIT64_15770 [Verrucomicrobiales bacterium]|nr:hypothetical protein [Verrucomicrobiales bacterium]
MQVKFLSDGSEYRSYGGGSTTQKKEGGGIFWWAVLITLLMGAATFCWFFSIMVFSQPEKPFNYKILAKFKKVTPLRPYTLYTAPAGKAFGPRELLTEFYPYSLEQLQLRNDLLKRTYLKNYQHEQPVYLLGSYKVLEVRQLTEGDVFSSGWVLHARASEFEDVDMEFVMPGLSLADAPCAAGDVIKLDKRAYASVLHLERLGQDRVCATVVPLAYQTVVFANGKSHSLTPPELLNIESVWPLTRDPGAESIKPVDGEKVGIAAPQP